MKNEEIRLFVEKVINEKVELLLNRIDSFQSSVFRDIEKLKDLDDLAQFSLPKEFFAQDDDADGAADILTLNEYVRKISTASISCCSSVASSRASTASANAPPCSCCATTNWWAGAARASPARAARSATRS